MSNPFQLILFGASCLAVLACSKDAIPAGGSAGNGGNAGVQGAAGAGGGGGIAGSGGVAGRCQSSGSVGFAGSPGVAGSCTPGNDKSCNEDPAIDTRLGACFPDRTCSCGTNAKSSFSGRCLNPDDDGSGCEYDRSTYSVGASVPVLGCGDRCSCTGPGTISCPPCACVPCALTQDYYFSISDSRGGAFYLPGNRISLVRPNPGSDTSSTCSAALPICDTPNAVDTSDLYADIADADVETAFMTSPAPIYGDQAASPGRFTFSRSVGGSFTVVVGFDCATTTPTCEPIPPGVRRLAEDVLAALARALADQNCTDCCRNFW